MADEASYGEYYGDYSGETAANAESDLAGEIAANATDPQSITVDGVTVSNRNLKDQIEADRYLAAKRAAKRAPFGVRFARVNPGGAVRE
ncbi:hypothetical protein [Aureliella helgolandensis]|uniref:Uncharacterized protein n=1 Tax=Aureliella helgolandensis TaxID=2527968 RepID=A0A518G4H2_9BACT|nr:hypothetical protein [Aureliella helgolandensis]QDV23439.1 hypothetical protein Q31a_17370 [Aureliella helgolandensis]